MGKIFKQFVVIIAILVMVATAMLTANAQVPHVSPRDGIGDVSPSDHYYDALRNIVDRYGINVGYPDGTFKGNQSLSRGEFVIYMNDVFHDFTVLLQAPIGDVDLLADDMEKITARLSNEHQSIEGELTKIKA